MSMVQHGLRLNDVDDPFVGDGALIVQGGNLWPSVDMDGILTPKRSQISYFPDFLPDVPAFELSNASDAPFMIVSLSGDATETICCSIDLLILAVKDLRMVACLTRAALLGGMYLFPFLGSAAFLVCLKDAGFACKPFVFPWTMLKTEPNHPAMLKTNV